MNIKFVTFDDKSINENRNKNFTIQVLHNSGKCALCEKKINKGEMVSRINTYGYACKKISMCLDCINYMQIKSQMNGNNS